MDTRYKVVTDGKLREGVEPEQFVSAFAQTFKVPEEQARKLLAAGRTITLKDNLDQDTAEKFRRVLSEQMGLEVRVEAKTGLSLESSEGMSVEGQTDQAATSNSGRRCPKCGSDRVSGDDCLACGIIISRYLARQAQTAEEAPSIYAAPASKVLPDNEKIEDGAPSIHKVAADSGWHWIVGGWQLFVRNPFAWIGTLILWYVIMFIGGLIPFIGSLAINILFPVFIAGLMLGAREQQEGGDFTVGHLFAGFSAGFDKLVIAGLLYLAAIVVAGIIVFVFMMIIGLSAMGHHAHASLDGGPAIGMIIIMVLVLVVIMVLIGMAFLYVPLLVVFDNIAPIEAIGMSFSAFTKNVIPFLIYMLICFGLSILAMIPIGLGFFVFMPVTMAAIYVSYRDIFHGEG